MNKIRMNAMWGSNANLGPEHEHRETDYPSILASTETDYLDMLPQHWD